MTRDKDDPIQPRKKSELQKRLEEILGIPPAPLVLPKDSNAVTVSVWPEGYWLEPTNTFFTIQLGRRPIPHKDNQPIKLSPKWIEAIDSVNVGLSGRRWLVLPGTRGVLAESESGGIYFPSPQIFGGGNPVKLLERRGNFVRIQTLNVHDDPPQSFVDWMVQNCGFWRRPRYYKARMLTVFDDYSAWVYGPAVK